MAGGTEIWPLLEEGAVADWLGISQSTLAEWRRKGTGPPFIQMASKLVKYDPEDVRRWLDEHKSGT
jgi:predicted DNA-binding transcriptional regulator AlpA